MLKPVPVEPVLSVKELYTLYYFHHESGYRFAGESHDFWEIIYVDKGRASGINGTEPYTLEKGRSFSPSQCFPQLSNGRRARR